MHVRDAAARACTYVLCEGEDPTREIGLCNDMQEKGWKRERERERESTHVHVKSAMIHETLAWWRRHRAGSTRTMHNNKLLYY